MARQPIARWFDAHDRFFQEPMRALLAGYTLEELREEYHRTYHARYADDLFATDLQALATRAYRA